MDQRRPTVLHHLQRRQIRVSTALYSLSVLCPSPDCQIRVRVITSESESESESSPRSPTPRVRVKNFFSSPSHESSSPHIQHNLFIFQNMKTNNKMYRMSAYTAQHGTALPLLLGLGRDSGPSPDF